MKLFITVCLLTLSLFSSSQQLSGKWLEMQRWDAKETPVSYYDTMRIHFLSNDSIKYQQKGVLAFIGKYRLLGDVISVEGSVNFLIVSRKENELVIKYDRVTRSFKPVAFFSDEKTRNDSVFIDYGNKIDLAVFNGKWYAYKREGSMPEKGYWMMRHIRFNNGKGELFRYTWEDGITDSITYSIQNNKLHVQSASFKNDFTIIKAQADEMILKDEKLTYYLKPTK